MTQAHPQPPRPCETKEGTFYCRPIKASWAMATGINLPWSSEVEAARKVLKSRDVRRPSIEALEKAVATVEGEARDRMRRYMTMVVEKAVVPYNGSPRIVTDSPTDWEGRTQYNWDDLDDDTVHQVILFCESISQDSVRFYTATSEAIEKPSESAAPGVAGSGSMF